MTAGAAGPWDRVRPRAAARGLFPIIPPLPAGGKEKTETFRFFRKNLRIFPEKAIDAPLDL